MSEGVEAADLRVVLLDPPAPGAGLDLLTWEEKALELTAALERVRPVLEAARAWRVALEALYRAPATVDGPEVWQWGKRHQIATQRLVAELEHMDGLRLRTVEEMQRAV